MMLPPFLPARILMCAGAALALGACESVRDTLGFNRHAPDEFAVTTRAPLALPNDFNLYPPTPGAPRPQEARTDDQAKTILMGDPSSAPSATPAPTQTPSLAEGALLSQSGADQADPMIRAQIASEKQSEVDQGAPTIDRILGPGTGATGKGVVIDPHAEAKRLKDQGLMK